MCKLFALDLVLGTVWTLRDGSLAELADVRQIANMLTLQAQTQLQIVCVSSVALVTARGGHLVNGEPYFFQSSHLGLQFLQVEGACVKCHLVL